MSCRDRESGERKDLPSVRTCVDCRNSGHGIYGGSDICSDGTAAPDPVMHYFGDTGIPRLDPSVFPVQNRRQKADREDNAIDRRKVR